MATVPGVERARVVVRQTEGAYDVGDRGWQQILEPDNLDEIRRQLTRGGWAARSLPDLCHIELDPDRLSDRPTIRGRRIAPQDVALDKLDAQLDDWVLVTADDALPDSHADAVRGVAAAVCTINPELEDGWLLDPWRREVVHRWAHAMHEQSTGTVRRYSLRRHGVWRMRRRRPRP